MKSTAESNVELALIEYRFLGRNENFSMIWFYALWMAIAKQLYQKLMAA